MNIWCQVFIWEYRGMIWTMTSSILILKSLKRNHHLQSVGQPQKSHSIGNYNDSGSDYSSSSSCINTSSDNGSNTYKCNNNNPTHLPLGSRPPQF